MTDFKLPLNFLEENPLPEISAAKLTHFQMVMAKKPEFDEEIACIVVPKMDLSRREAYENEREQILNCKSAHEIIRIMRKLKEQQNRYLLMIKALEMEEEVMPLILESLLTSGHDQFIEMAVIILGNTDEKYVLQLFSDFNKIRNVYARSEVCILFGIKGRTEYAPFLLQQYELIKRERPDKDYNSGPLLALHLIYGD